MAETPKLPRIDPKVAREGRDRIIKEDGKQRDQDAPGSHDPSGTADSAPTDDRRNGNKGDSILDTGFVRRTD